MATAKNETDFEELKKVKAELAELKKKKKIEKLANNELDVTVQYRESSGIHKMIERQAKQEKLSVGLYVRKLVREKFGIGA